MICPVCQTPNAILRSYNLSVGRRTWLECAHCRIVRDNSEGEGADVVLSLDSPFELSSNSSCEVLLTIKNANASIPTIGAALIGVDGIGHGIASQPPLHPVIVGPGEVVSCKTQLISPRRPKTAHQFYLRAIVLLNGRWWWLSRPLSLLRPEKPRR